MVMLRLFIGFILLIASVTACSGGPWPKGDQEKFMSDCKDEGGEKSYCSCYLENVMEKYPNVSDFEKMDFETAVELSKDCE